MIRDRSLSVWIFDIQTRGDRCWKIHAKKYTGVYRHRAERETVRTAKSEQVVVIGHLRLLTRYVIALIPPQFATYTSSSLAYVYDF